MAVQQAAQVDRGRRLRLGAAQHEGRVQIGMLALGRAAGLQHRRIDGGRHRWHCAAASGANRPWPARRCSSSACAPSSRPRCAARAQAEQAVERRLQADRQFLALQRDLQCDEPMLMRAMPGLRMGMGMRMGTGSDGMPPAAVVRPEPDIRADRTEERRFVGRSFRDGDEDGMRTQDGSGAGTSHPVAALALGAVQRRRRRDSRLCGSEAQSGASTATPDADPRRHHRTVGSTMRCSGSAAQPLGHRQRATRAGARQHQRELLAAVAAADRAGAAAGDTARPPPAAPGRRPPGRGSR